MSTTARHALSLIATALSMFALSTNAAPPLSGAIFTTTEDGSVVNGNVIYNDKCDVYLDGGPPPGAPQQAAGLPDGHYYFQVTDPSGKKLLSTDPVSNREIIVSGGIITGYTGTHATHPDVDHGGNGAIVVQLCPYIDTPNNGGVYKAWVVPIGDGTVSGGGFIGDPSLVDNSCGNGCFHGFLPARSKTDNFKVGDKTPTFCLLVEKKANSKTGPYAIANWKITITDPLGVENTYYTGPDGTLEQCSLTDGKYTVTESLTAPDGSTYDVVYSAVNGTEVSPPTKSVEIQWTPGKDDPQVVQFINQFVCDKNCK